ncbi:TerB N-terminal domain-containing protein [Paenibacillus sp. A14]|uniref:TerB N-terminal domain-containing protein n=1 Tax=Paenibacillus sp. A14 TaxID=3119820 RepID=UPI002FE3C1F3
MNEGADKHGMSQEKKNPRTTREQGLTFAELELDFADHADYARPVAREEPQAYSRIVMPESVEREIDWRENFRYVSREEQFVRKAKELEGETVESAEFVPFQHYWPTYEEMQPAQLKWYLHWRGEVRAGRYPDTDLSYLFVYLYELIHGIGWREPSQGFELIRRVWQEYRQRYPKLDLYAREWLYDFALVFGLDLPRMEPLLKFPRNLSTELRELEWYRRFTAEPLGLSWDMLTPLLDYEVEKSRFYTGQGRKDLQQYAPKVVSLVDGYMSKAQGNRLLARFKPREKKVKRHLFRSAVYDFELHGRSVPVTVLPVSEHPPLRDYVTQLVRLTENKLRELTGFKGKLRGIAVEPDVEQLVDRFLRKELEQRKAEEAKARAPKVKINTVKLRKLQKESDEVRDLLLAEELAGAGEAPWGEPAPVAGPIAGSEPGRRKPGKRKQAGPEQAELDFERGWLAFADESESEIPVTEPEMREFPAAAIEMSEPPAPFSDRNPEAEGLPAVWRGMYARFGGAHLQMLSALLNGEDASSLYAIAEQAGSMPELLLDEINEIAMEEIGDLLVDGEDIPEEYRPELGKLLGRAAD